MIIKNKLFAICGTFTLITVLDSLVNVLSGGGSDDYLHLLARFVVCVIAIGSMYIFEWLDKWVAYVVHYVSTLGLIFIFIWISGFFVELHPDAYVDFFFAYSTIHIVFDLVVLAKTKISKRTIKKAS